MQALKKHKPTLIIPAFPWNMPLIPLPLFQPVLLLWIYSFFICADGSGLAGKFWDSIPQSVVDQVAVALLAGEINWFDTAEMYRNGALELTLSPYELDKLDPLSRQFK
jgi:hypothetical protein